VVSHLAIPFVPGRCIGVDHYSASKVGSFRVRVDSWLETLQSAHGLQH
jgi:hypothetical protein